MIHWNMIREILSLALPAVGEMTLYMMIWILDTMMVGQYGGKLAVSSVGLSTEIIYSFFNILIAMGMSSSLTSLISRALGAKDFKKAERIANAGFKISFGLAILFFLVLFFVPKQILTLAGATKDMLPSAVIYAKISAFSFFLLTFSSTNNGIFRGAKDTKTSLYIAALINIVNLSLDYVLIFGKFGFPELGVKGAAIATVAGNGAGLLLQWFRLKKLPFHLHLFSSSKKEDFKEVILLAVPSALQEANFSLSKLLGITFVMSLGTIAFAANQIGIAIEAVSFMPGWGIAIANTALVGHSIGEKNEKKAHDYTFYSTIIASIFMGIIALIFFFFPEELIRLFIQKEEIEVISAGALCLQVGAMEQIPIAFAMVIESYFKGTGDAKTPFYVSFIMNWCIRVPLAFYFISIQKYPIHIFWLITTIQWTLEGILIYYLYHRKGKIILH